MRKERVRQGKRGCIQQRLLWEESRVIERQQRKERDDREGYRRESVAESMVAKKKSRGRRARRQTEREEIDGREERVE